MTATTTPETATPATKKPVANSRAAKLAPVTLTKDEAEWLQCYRVMSLRSRGECLSFAQDIAAEFPMIKPKALPIARGIRLVAADGNLVAPPCSD